MDNSITTNRPRIVIIGAGFAGIFCAKGICGEDADITLIDKQNHHLFQPLLYQVATGFLGINDVAMPIRSLFPGEKNVRVVMEEVTGVDTTTKTVKTASHYYEYDYLVIATGARYHFFGHDDWEPHMMVLKTMEDAITLRGRILTSFEEAELEKNPEKRRQLLTYVVIGGGPTGIEMAGAIADIINYALEREFRNITRNDTSIYLLEAAPRLLGAMKPNLSAHAEARLRQKGVRVICNSTVSNITPNKVTTSNGEINTNVILWAAGVHANPIAGWLGVTPNRNGTINVEPNLSVPNHENVFVAGDAACVIDDEKPLPALASVAKQEGKYLARLLTAKIRKEPFSRKFRYADYGTMATIGRNSAVAQFRYINFTGRFAWMLWGIVHIFFLTGFRNRMSVFLTWLWTYMTFGMGARVILKRYPKKPS